MIKVKYARPSPDGKRVQLGIECEGELLKLSVSERVYSSLGAPVSASELCEEELNEAKASDTEYRAMKKALSLLSFADNNKKNLYLKLLRAGFGREVASETVRECVRLGYIDERRQLLRLVADEANRRLHGPRLIQGRLYAKGYRVNDISAALEELIATGEIDLCANFDYLCEKNSAQTDEERLALRYKFGYGSDVN